MKRSKIILLAGMLVSTTAFAQTTNLNVQDTRHTSTTPGNYIRSFEPHFKAGSYIGLPEAYYTVLGLRGWGDNTGGKSFELAFSYYGDLHLRSGFEPTWEAWRKVLISDANGNLGLGIANPQAKLHVSNDANTSGAPLNSQLLIAGATHPDKMLSIAYNTSSNYAELQSQAFAGSYSSIVLNPNGGDIGIGTTTPREKLTVNGKIRAKEIKVEATNWPDYVFKSDYKLNTLPELEAYIKSNGHLPEVPAAAEVEKEGVALGEMNKILLKKIEELTLHLIEKDKELQQVKTENLSKEKTIREQLLHQEKQIQLLKDYLKIK
jgi:hypothetical protein